MIIDIIGWVGTVLVLVAYFLITSEKLGPKSRAYNLMNLFGALFIGLNVYVNHAWPALGLQTVWGGVAIISLFKNLRLQNRR
ncbi:MAG TPA: hypothetical protein VFW77_00305 [Candidatus Saccharimonadales bacterium]|nr:hypothetical protein [Candidatus Saccharimonadales bacterium]